MEAQEEVSQEVVQIREIIQSILKTKKLHNLYPTNNPISIKATDESYSLLSDFLTNHDELKLFIIKDEILYQEANVYTGQNKEDSLAMFFFKDGLRELTFLPGFHKKEFCDFISILNSDFQNEMVDDDVVTLLWEKGFEHLKYVVDENALYDAEDGEPPKITPSETEEEEAPGQDKLLAALDEALKEEEELPTNQIVPITDEDRKAITREISQEGENISDKLVIILIELIFNSHDMNELTEIVHFLSETILYSIKEGSFYRAIRVLDAVALIKQKEDFYKERKTPLDELPKLINSEQFINEMVNAAESDIELNERDFMAYAERLHERVVPQLLERLADVSTERGKKLITDTVALLSERDMNTLVKGIRSPNWFVVKTTISLLGRSKERQAIEHIKKGLSHIDSKVRMESIRALSASEHQEAVPALKLALNDSEKAIRIAAINSLGKFHHVTAKNVIFYELKKKEFVEKEFAEKKRFYAILAEWHDPNVTEFLIKTLKSSSLFTNVKLDETRACAAYAIGLQGIKEAIPFLKKTCRDKNELLRTYSLEALQKMADNKT
jgi:HEAT repeat protein